MRRLFVITSLAFAIAGSFAFAPAAQAQDKKADQILKDLAKVEMPAPPPREKQNDRQIVLEYFRLRQEAMTRRAELIGELYKAEPNHPKLIELLPERWQALMGQGPEGLKEELSQVAKNAKDSKLKVEASYWSTIITLRANMNKPDVMLKAVDEFTKLAPKDERAAILLYSVGTQLSDPAEQAKLYKKVVKDFPESRVAKMVEGTLKQLDSVGKPFELEFTDAIKGTTVSMKNLKGKVVVVDFWATWCGPCVAEMPKMKQLYAEYKAKGVEFIGVSLDQAKEEGGLDKLKEFVSKNEIDWPQYYQGNGWESEFSRSWGINAIPAVFIVDTQGKLFSVNARGKLGEMIPELLKKAKTDAGAGAGAGGN